MSENKNYFEELYQTSVSKDVEKKGKFNYLSWAVAVKELKLKYPNATWEVVRHNGMPYIKSDIGYFVEVAVTVEGVTHSQIHPVLNNQNRPIENPNPFDINNSIQRCLAKAIALHGLGIALYTGEDLEQYNNTTDSPKTQNTSNYGGQSASQSGSVGSGSKKEYTASPKQIKFVNDLVNQYATKLKQDAGDIQKLMLQKMGITTFDELTGAKAQTWIEFLQKEIQK